MEMGRRAWPRGRELWRGWGGALFDAASLSLLSVFVLAAVIVSCCYRLRFIALACKTSRVWISGHP